jgi:hypothetical protein
MKEKSPQNEQPHFQGAPQGVGVLAPAEISKGVYSNSAVVRHTLNEFVIDFLFQLDTGAQLVSRVIMSPAHMKLFRDAVEHNLAMFEEKQSQH